MQEAFTSHRLQVGWMSPWGEHKCVVLVTNNAPWHPGKPFNEALADNPHLEFKRQLNYSPKLNAIEHFWKLLRRRATHNRCFESLEDLRGSIWASLCFLQSVSKQIRGLVAESYVRLDDQKASAVL